ncbi:hypothetical protein SLE2022_083730 [Rubroshorea leprosula]
MSSYGYMYGGYSSTQNGVGSWADDWNNSICSSSSDDACWPVLVDAEGRKMLVISYDTPNNNSGYYIPETETTVRTYGSTADEEAWSRPSSLVQRPVEDKWNPHTELVNGFPKKVNELTNKVLQCEAVLSPYHSSPLVSEDKNSSKTKVEPLGTSNGPVEKILGRPSSSVEKSTVEKNLGRPSSTVEKNLDTAGGFSQQFDDYIKRVRANYTNNSTEEVEPAKTNGGVTEKKCHSRTSPVMHSEPVNGVPKMVDDFINKPQSVQNVTSPWVSDYKQSSPTKVEPIATNSSVTIPANYPKINEFFNTVQTEASRPRLGPLGATYWPQTAQVTPAYGYGGDLANKAGQPRNEPVMISSGGWSRPRSHVTWALPPEGSSTNPTFGINTAIEHPREIEKPSPMINTPPGSQVAMPVSTGWRTDGYASTIDGREAARRYANFNFSSRYPKNEAYTATIDSREAARKYGGFSSPSYPKNEDCSANFNFSPRYPKNEAYRPTIDSREAARKYGGTTV